MPARVYSAAVAVKGLKDNIKIFIFGGMFWFNPRKKYYENSELT